MEIVKLDMICFNRSVCKYLTKIRIYFNVYFYKEKIEKHNSSSFTGDKMLIRLISKQGVFMVKEKIFNSCRFQ